MPALESCRVVSKNTATLLWKQSIALGSSVDTCWLSEAASAPHQSFVRRRASSDCPLLEIMKALRQYIHPQISSEYPNFQLELFRVLLVGRCAELLNEFGQAGAPAC